MNSVPSTHTSSEDKNGDGVEDATTEPPLAGWTIYIDLDQDGQLDPGEPHETTDATGWCEFNDLAPYTTYHLAEVPQPDWEQTCPPPASTHVEVKTTHAQFTYMARFGNHQIPRDYGDAPDSYGTLKASKRRISHCSHPCTWDGP